MSPIMQAARRAARQSQCVRRQIGAVVVPTLLKLVGEDPLSKEVSKEVS